MILSIHQQPQRTAFLLNRKKMSRNGRLYGKVVIAGNHDNPERLTAATSVLARHSVGYRRSAR